jgi:hypothetical protein
MEGLDCFRHKDIEVQLASYERESSALAREALCPTTSETRRVEALISRAEIQARIVALVQGMEGIQSEPTTDRAPECKWMQSNPWPRVEKSEGSIQLIGYAKESTPASEL